MLCDAGLVSAIRQPTGPAHYEVGQLTLRDGTTLEVWGDDNGTTFLKAVKVGDVLEVCFGPSRRWADEPANARDGFVVALRTGATYTTVGTPGTGAIPFPPRTEGGARRRPTAP
ncbi:MAG: hypothetical protein ABR975_10410 [Vulcanimicrobiaceae bacterium]|jgi:hypothetical protein